MTTLSQNSCYKVTYTELNTNGGTLIIGFEFSESVFMHAVTHAQDHRGGHSSNIGTAHLKHLLQNYEIYIGDSPDYSQNTKVPGGPFLHPDHQDTYVYFLHYYNSNKDPFGKGRGYVWLFGKENWVNLEGRFMHLVADMSG